MDVEGIRTYNMMKNLFENTDLNINSWLINWGYMNGYLKDGQIHANKYYIIYQLMVIIMLLLNLIRSVILLFSAKESHISLLLGDWSYFLGPRIMLNGIIFSVCFYILMLMAFFKFCTRNSQKMFYWLNIMDYDSENRCYFNMSLNESDSKIFINRSLILIIAFKCVTAFCIPCFTMVIFISILIHLNDNYLNQLITFLIFVVLAYHCIAYCFGLSVILYLVSINLVNQIFNHYYVCFQVCFYFTLKFHNFNIKAIKLLNSKLKRKIKVRRIYLLIKEHNGICFMLNRFNDFWKTLMVFIFSFYILLIWSMAYPSIVYSNINLFQRIYMWLCLIESIVAFFYISSIIFSISSEVINKQIKIIKYK